MTQAVLTIIAFLAILLSLHVFIIAWLLWQHRCLKRNSNATHPSSLVVYASQSGQAESWAKHTAEQLGLAENQIELLDIQELTIEHLQQYQRILWVVSTYGEGDAPDSAQHFSHKILSQSLDLSHVSFAILALGDRRYSQFCQFGLTLNQWLIQQSARELFPLVCADNLHAHDLQLWMNGLEQLSSSQLTILNIQKDVVSLKLAHRECINVGSAGEAIYKVQLVSDMPVHWLSGDILEIQCENSDIEIDTFLSAHQLSVESSDINQLRTLNLRHLPERHNQLFDLWIQGFQTLARREYSIASLPSNGCIELVVRQQQTATGLGLGSGWLTEGLQLGQQFNAHIQDNPSFHLAHDDRPVILIGNGTGIAGLMAHLRQREQWGFTQNWLIFGERQQEFDHLYQTKIDYWQQHGFLTHVDYAFSRDQAEKIYVQDRLREQSERLIQWIAQGAAIYVCGSLKGMAGGVDQVLRELLGNEQLEQLKREQRYQRDIY